MELLYLTEKRRKHSKSLSDNKDNSHEIISGLYSDPSHFIYEILQIAGCSHARLGQAQTQTGTGTSLI